MKIGLGMMVRKFNDTEPLASFLSNAREYERRVDSVIVGYSEEADSQVAQALTEEFGVPVTLTKINDHHKAERELGRLGVSEESVKKLLVCNKYNEKGLVPYGFNRNNLLIEAVLSGVDILFYIDDDVFPYMLRKKNKQVWTEGIDFFGRHLEYIDQGAMFTTSDYSGYNILPYARFDGMEELLIGLQKEDMLGFWLRARDHDCLYVQQNDPPMPRRTRKVLGGNMAMDLRDHSKLIPFFSPTFEVNDKMYLARGEDTLIALFAEEYGYRCVNIDMHIFHNAYGDYPEIPSLKDKEATQERFFFACMGWIGRNPFLNHLHGTDTAKRRLRQRINLEEGAKALVKYTENPIFSILPKAHNAAWEALPEMIRDYEETMNAWREFIDKVSKGD